MKTYIKENKKGLIILIVGIILLVTMLIIHNTKTPKNLQVSSLNIFNSKMIETQSNKNITKEEILAIFLISKKGTIEFLAKTFQIDYETLVKYIKANYEEINILNDDDFEYNLIEYLYKLEDENKELFSSKINITEKDKDYMVSLIKYYCEIYPAVNFEIAAAISQVESGYKSQTMINKNNIFGGMSNGKLIKYKNIEYGILSYIRLLNNNYFEKGLTTVETIGKKYNPIYNANGQKIANSTWVENVKNDMQEFKIENYNLIIE